jgi:hypothetical protein
MNETSDRTTIESHGFTWSDAWLLAAVYCACLGGEPTLSRILAAGDFINRTVFSLSELNGGLDRLERGGFVALQGGLCVLTELGRAATLPDPKAKKGVFYHLETVRERLGVAACTTTEEPGPVGDGGHPKVYVTEGMLHEALAEYRGCSGKRSALRQPNETIER